MAREGRRGGRCGWRRLLSGCGDGGCDLSPPPPVRHHPIGEATHRSALRRGAEREVAEELRRSQRGTGQSPSSLSRLHRWRGGRGGRAARTAVEWRKRFLAHAAASGCTDTSYGQEGRSVISRLSCAACALPLRSLSLRLSSTCRLRAACPTLGWGSSALLQTIAQKCSAVRERSCEME